MEHLLAATNKVVELHNENVQLHTELADAKCKLAKYQNDSGDDSLYNVRRLRSELNESIKQRDEARRLAEKYRYLSGESQEEADETLLPWENNQPKPESKDPHRFCRGGGGNNFHCGCKYDG